MYVLFFLKNVILLIWDSSLLVAFLVLAHVRGKLICKTGQTQNTWKHTKYKSPHSSYKRSWLGQCPSRYAGICAQGPVFNT